ncbi:MAG TPA: hypothetical protein PKC21_05865 [Oligoflexia bacterium]|nr:hypothetical protein [Oligoflexia bacterium]HMR24860.1 hypothetical protein [Oligoflexia bacterium]
MKYLIIVFNLLLGNLTGIFINAFDLKASFIFSMVATGSLFLCLDFLQKRFQTAGLGTSIILSILNSLFIVYFSFLIMTISLSDISVQDIFKSVVASFLFSSAAIIPAIPITLFNIFLFSLFIKTLGNRSLNTKK